MLVGLHVLFMEFMCWLWPTCDGHGVYVMDLSYL